MYGNMHTKTVLVIKNVNLVYQLYHEKFMIIDQLTNNSQYLYNVYLDINRFIL